MQKRDKANDRAANVDSELDNVSPDNGSHATFRGVDERERHYNGDGSHTARPKGNADYNCHGPHANTFSSGTRDEKDASSDTMQLFSEATVDELVGCEHLTAEICGIKSKLTTIRPSR